MSMSWPVLLAIAGGGALGAVLRYLTGAAMAALLGTRFPWGTLSVNVLGSFAMGLAAVWLMRLDLAQGSVWKPFLMTGLLGGFTTFSAFSLEAHTLLERGDTGSALAYMGGSVALGLLALMTGLTIGRAV